MTTRAPARRTMPAASRHARLIGEAIPRPKVSAVIPARNEAENLSHVLPAVARLVDEVILVDGNSTDETILVARNLVPGIRIVRQEGAGKGGALRQGFSAATGDIIVMLDADGSTDPKEIPFFVGALLAGADFAKGTRFAQGAGSSDMSRVRNLGNRVFVWMVRLLFGGRYSDLCYGYNAFWRDVLPELRLTTEGFEIETSMNIEALRARLRIVEVPSFEKERIHGTSNLRAIPDGLRVLRAIVRARLARPAAAVFEPAIEERKLGTGANTASAATARLALQVAEDGAAPATRRGGWDAPIGVTAIVQGRVEPPRTEQFVRSLARAVPDRPLEIVFLADAPLAQRSVARNASAPFGRDVRFVVAESGVLDLTAAARLEFAVRHARGSWVCTVGASAPDPGAVVHELFRATRSRHLSLLDDPVDLGAPPALARRNSVLEVPPEQKATVSAGRRLRSHGRSRPTPATLPPAIATNEPGAPSSLVTLAICSAELVGFTLLLDAGVHYLSAAAVAAHAAILLWLVHGFAGSLRAGRQGAQSRGSRLRRVVAGELGLAARMVLLVVLVAGLAVPPVLANSLTLVALLVGNAFCAPRVRSSSRLASSTGSG